jgi:L-arabinose isomerase
MSDAYSNAEIWYLTGSQHLYGPQALKQVDINSAAIVKALNESKKIPVKIVAKPVLTTPEDIYATLQQASVDPKCVGVVLWMHTFSPSKMWIRGLQALSKPILHLHTQFNRDLPWDTIDMDFMNLNQAAHGDREAGHMHTRMRLNRKVVVGHWSDKAVQEQIAGWTRVAVGWADLQGARFARIGDNMRYVAVTEGDKVAAESRFGFAVNTYGVGDVVKYVNAVTDAAISKLCDEYEGTYKVSADLKKGGKKHNSLRDGARLELGLRAFLTEGKFKGFTTTFEDLHGLTQLPGLACQRLMTDGYGFGAEGDWKTCAILRAMKTMGQGLSGGTSFMEDYTYHLDPKDSLVLGSHMLEICPSIASAKPTLECHPLGIGGKADPVRLVFDAPAGAAINVSICDMGNRFRLVVNEVDVINAPKKLPKLPVARAVWRCKPDFKTACASWIYAGGAHHTVLSYTVSTDQIRDFAELANVEVAVIDAKTDVNGFKQTLRNNDITYALATGLARL